MRIPEYQPIPSPFTANFFCLLPGFRTAFVTISKNGGTFLAKLAIYFRTDQIIEDKVEIHNTLGYYNPSSRYLIPVSQMPQYEKENGKMLKFAVWRDPLERLVSCYKHFILERNPHRYFHFLDLYHDTSFDRFMEFVEFELKKANPDFQDPHIRKQSDCYRPEDVDFIVPIRKLNRFLTEHKIPLIDDKSNATDIKFEFDAIKWEERIKELYRADYAIHVNY